MEQCHKRQDRVWDRRRYISCVVLSLLLLAPSVRSSPQSDACRQPCDNVNCGSEVLDCAETFLFCGGCCTACSMELYDPCTNIDPSRDVGLCASGLVCEEELPGINPGVCVEGDPPTEATTPVPHCESQYKPK